MSILRQYIRLVEETTSMSDTLSGITGDQIVNHPNYKKYYQQYLRDPNSANSHQTAQSMAYTKVKSDIMAAQQQSTGNTAPRQTPGIVPPDSPYAQQYKQKSDTNSADAQPSGSYGNDPKSPNAKVAALQQDLKAAGADLGPFANDGVDGLMGKYTRAAMAQFPEIAAKHPEAAKMPDAPPGSGKAIKGGQRTNPSSPETNTDGGEALKPEDTKPKDPTAVRPEVKAMADLLDQLVQQAQLKESQRNDPTEQIKQYKSIVEKADQNIDEYTNNPWIGGSPPPQPAPAPGQNFGQKALGTIKTAGNIAKKAAPFIGAGVGLWGLVDQGRQIQQDFEEGDLGSAALGSLSALAYALSIPAKLTPYGIGLGVGGYLAGAAADARRAGRGGRKVVDMVDKIQAKLKDPNNGFTPAESKLLGDKVAQVRAQLIRNNIPIDL